MASQKNQGIKKKKKNSYTDFEINLCNYLIKVESFQE